MASNEDTGSPGWGASLFMQTTEDVARAVAAAAATARSPRPSVVFTSKEEHADNPLSKLRSRFSRVLKSLTSPTTDTNSINYNPEVLTSQKRQWANFQLQYLDHRAWREPTRLFESMVVVGLHPNCNLQALQGQYISRKSEGSGILQGSLGGQNQSRIEPVIEPQVLFVYPPEKRLPLKYKDLLSFCFPGGVEVHAVERTPSMSELNEILLGQGHLKQSDLSFVFRLQVADDSTLYGCCMLVEEIVQKPSELLSMILEEQPASSSLGRYSRFVLTTRRCYCILSRLPFFELHFGVLNSIFTEERLQRLTKSINVLGFESQDEFCNEEDVDENVDYISVNYKDTKVAGSEKLDVSQSSVGASLPHRVPHDDHQPEHQSVETIEDTEDAVSETLDVSLSSVRASTPDSVPHDGHHPEHQGVERLEDTEDVVSGKPDVSQPNVRASIPDSVPHDGHHPEHQGVERLEDTEDAVSEKLDVSQSNVIALIPDRVPHDGHHLEHKGVEGLEDTENALSEKLDVPQYSVRASIPDSVPHDGHHPEHQGGERIERIEDTEDALSEKLDVPQYSVRASIPDSIPHDGHHLERQDVERIEDTEDAVSEKLDVSLSSVRASIPDCVPHDGHHPEHQGIERREDTGDAVSENLDVLQSSARASIPSVPHDCHQPEHQGDERLEDLPKETVYNNAIPINSESDVVPTVQVSVGANIQDCGRDNLMSNNQAGESRLPSAVLSLFCYYNSDIPESSSSFQDSLVDERNFRGNHDESGAEGASVSGQEDSDYLVEILEWAKANNRNSLLILCDYYSLHCPARGSKLRFHPLDHLHSLEYHRPDATVLNVAGSTINVQSCSTSLEFVEAQCALLAEEEAAALSTWAVACMCGSLRLEHVLTIFAGALLEKQIVVVCSNLGILSALVLSIVPLIRPYRWQSLLMPVLPNDMLDFLDAPVPYIVGVKNKTSEVQSKLTNVILVDASKNQVKSPTVPQLPRQRELFSSLSPYHAKLVGESFLARKRPVYECTDVQVEAARGFLGVVRSYLDSLCSNLRSHTITNVQSNNDKVSLLLKESFIDSFPSRDRPFMKLFVDTQLFSVHTDLALSFFQKE